MAMTKATILAFGIRRAHSIRDEIVDVRQLTIFLGIQYRITMIMEIIRLRAFAKIYRRGCCIISSRREQGNLADQGISALCALRPPSTESTFWTPAYAEKDRQRTPTGVASRHR